MMKVLLGICIGVTLLIVIAREVLELPPPSLLQKHHELFSSTENTQFVARANPVCVYSHQVYLLPATLLFAAHAVVTKQWNRVLNSVPLRSTIDIYSGVTSWVQSLHPK
jgi:hypothetical protein